MRCCDNHDYDDLVASLLLLLFFVGLVLWKEEGDGGLDRLGLLCGAPAPFGVVCTSVSCTALAVAMVNAEMS